MLFATIFSPGSATQHNGRSQVDFTEFTRLTASSNDIWQDPEVKVLESGSLLLSFGGRSTRKWVVIDALGRENTQASSAVTEQILSSDLSCTASSGVLCVRGARLSALLIDSKGCITKYESETGLGKVLKCVPIHGGVILLNEDMTEGQFVQMDSRVSITPLIMKETFPNVAHEVLDPIIISPYPPVIGLFSCNEAFLKIIDCRTIKSEESLRVVLAPDSQLPVADPTFLLSTCTGDNGNIVCVYSNGSIQCFDVELVSKFEVFTNMMITESVSENRSVYCAGVGGRVCQVSAEGITVLRELDNHHAPNYEWSPIVALLPSRSQNGVVCFRRNGSVDSVNTSASVVTLVEDGGYVLDAELGVGDSNQLFVLCLVSNTIQVRVLRGADVGL
ncbi:hypothetical protein IT575_10230 [bacterium]|nr:hypothetical protein [bacterium]